MVGEWFEEKNMPTLSYKVKDSKSISPLNIGGEESKSLVRKGDAIYDPYVLRSMLVALSILSFQNSVEKSYDSCHI